MGTWGWKIFQNDDAADINATYKEKLIVGIPDAKAEDDIVREFQLSQNINLWIPLAVTQWKLGRLSDRAKENALVSIENELSAIHELWEPDFVEKRRIELFQTKEILNSEMPKRKKLRTPVWAYKCPWHIGNAILF